MLPRQSLLRRFRRSILAHTSNEQAAAGRARSVVLDRRAGSGSGNTNRACGRADGVQMMCSTERLLVRLHVQVGRSLTRGNTLQRGYEYYQYESSNIVGYSHGAI